MLFPWQEQDWQRLNGERTRLPNAWLFIGPAGTGKLEFALHLAQSLLCEQLQADHQPCGQCEGCRWFEHGTHPDFRRLSPQTEEEEEGKGKAKEEHGNEEVGKEEGKEEDEEVMGRVVR